MHDVCFESVWNPPPPMMMSCVNRSCIISLFFLCVSFYLLLLLLLPTDGKAEEKVKSTTAKDAVGASSAVSEASKAVGAAAEVRSCTTIW